ncbi:LOW QUALITY PROTEIN: hypothetical protein ACHAWF_018891 [Thalassiosira exigua]
MRSFITGKPLVDTLVSLLYKGRSVVGDRSVRPGRTLGQHCRAAADSQRRADTNRRRIDLVRGGNVLHDTGMFQLSDESLMSCDARCASCTTAPTSTTYAYILVVSGFGADVVVVIEADLGLYDYCAFVPVIEGAGGVTPLHYACAYGATERALRVLTDANLHTVSAADHRGRTPLHFALGNADRPASPGVVALLLSQNPAVVDAVDLEGNLPVHLLATRAGAIKEHEKEKRANCRECFRKYLEAGPNATADLLTALQSLPDWLRDEAVLSPVVQKILNAKIATRFPTMIVVMDLFFYVLVIAFFQVAVVESLRDRHADPPKDEMHRGWLAPLYLAAFYFSAREVVQAFSLAILGLFDTWVSDLENWLDVIYVFFILFWAVVMNGKWLSTDAFQIGTALTMALFWVMVLNFLRSIIVGFAVFVGGVVYVMKRLLSFLLALAVILIMFTMIFHTLFRDPTGQCPSQNATDYTQFPVVVFDCGVDLATGDEECEKAVDYQPINTDPFCNFRTSFFKVLTMLLGEVDEVYFQSNVLLVLAYAVFMFACVIVLANVLIAIVTSSYSVIQNERAALVFWSNRLDFVAEMDVISNNFSRRPREGGARDAEESSSGELWKKFMYLFDDDVEEHGILSVEFVCYNVLRFFALFFVVPLWILLGLVTFGLLWPPQVRVWLLTSQMTSVSKEASAERSRLQQVRRLKEDVALFQEEVRGEMERGRNEMHVVRTVLEGTRNDIHEEISNVKEIVTELFELLSAP